MSSVSGLTSGSTNSRADLLGALAVALELGGLGLSGREIEPDVGTGRGAAELDLVIAVEARVDAVLVGDAGQRHGTRVGVVADGRGVVGAASCDQQEQRENRQERALHGRAG
jgi:hypothetical protein